MSIFYGHTGIYINVRAHVFEVDTNDSEKLYATN